MSAEAQGCDLGSSPDFVMLAKAYGGQGRMVRGPVIGAGMSKDIQSTGKPWFFLHEHARVSDGFL